VTTEIKQVADRSVEITLGGGSEFGFENLCMANSWMKPLSEAEAQSIPGISVASFRATIG
jgi:hypothetical protein